MRVSPGRHRVAARRSLGCHTPAVGSGCVARPAAARALSRLWVGGPLAVRGVRRRAPAAARRPGAGRARRLPLAVRVRGRRAADGHRAEVPARSRRARLAGRRPVRPPRSSTRGRRHVGSDHLGPAAAAGVRPVRAPGPGAGAAMGGRLPAVARPQGRAAADRAVPRGPARGAHPARPRRVPVRRRGAGRRGRRRDHHRGHPDRCGPGPAGRGRGVRRRSDRRRARPGGSLRPPPCSRCHQLSKNLLKLPARPADDVR